MAADKPTLKRKTFGASTLALLAVLFLGLIVLSNHLLRGLRVDLTENNQYTLAPGTVNILRNIAEPINLYFYFSRAAGEESTLLRLYARRVQELLEEMSARARGRIRLHVIDPEPFSEEEDRAAELGLRSIPIGMSGRTMYFGLAGTNSTDGKEVIPVFHPDKEQFLEYDIAKLIVQLNTPRKPRLGLMTSLPMNFDYDPQTGRQRDAWMILTQLQQLFAVETISTSANSIPQDIDVLVVAHPKNVPDRTQFAIEQFLMRGGRALIFVDPRAEADPAGQDMQMFGPDGQRDPYASMFAPRHSSLEKLFKAWGVEFDPQQVVTDVERALPVSTQMGAPPVRHLGFLGMNKAALNDKDVITATIDSINFAMPGSFKLSENSPLELEPLVQTGTQSGTIPASRFMLMGDPSSLRDDFRSTGERRVIAARLTGRIETAFPDGPPGEGDNQKEAGADASFLKSSEQPVNLILVADADVLSDMLWVRRQSFFGQTIAQAFASNGDFVMNAVDNLAGNSDLISIRGRASFVRPFTRVEDIKRRAEDRFRAKEKELEEELEATEKKLEQLEKQNDDPMSAFILTPEQEEELKRFQEEKIRIRKELREVRHGMDREIEQLGRTVRMLNIGLMPLLVTGAALGAAAWRRRRRSLRQGGQA